MAVSWEVITPNDPPESKCSSSCPTQDHESYGACLKSKRLGKPIIR